MRFKYNTDLLATQRLNKSAVLLVSVLFFVGCSEQPPKGSDESKISNTPISASPSSAIAIGKTRATEQFIAKKWQVISINDQPVTSKLVLDLHDFSRGQGEFCDDCERILVDLNIHDVSNERLSIDNSTRQGGDCSSELIDTIMWILSDVYAFERSGDELHIIAVQDTIRLVPSD